MSVKITFDPFSMELVFIVNGTYSSSNTLRVTQFQIAQNYHHNLNEKNKTLNV